MDPIKRKWPHPALCIAVFTIAVPLSSAQEVATPTASTDETEQETVVLSPFEVRTESDVGYVATSSLAGSRMNTPLELTPVSISVLTSELINDIGATNINQAMEYATGAGNDITGGANSDVGAATGNGLVENFYNFQIRGYRNIQATREYFPTLIASDSFNLDRIDVARGPNSILFGVGGAGGIIDSTPKKAVSSRDFNQVRLWVGSWSKYRASVDVNRSLANEKLGVRVNALWQDADGYRDFERDDQRRGAISLVGALTRTTTIRFQGEVGKLEQNRPRPWSPYESYSQTDASFDGYIDFGTPERSEPGITGTQWPNDTNDNVSLRSFGFSRVGVLTDVGTNPVNFQPQWFGHSNVFGFPSQGQRFYRISLAQNLPGFNTPRNIDDESIFPRTGNPAGPGNLSETDYHLLSLFIDQRVGRNLNLQLAVSRQDVDILRRTAVPFSSIKLSRDLMATLPTFNADRSWNGTLSENAIDTPLGPLGAIIFNETVPNPYVGKFLVYSQPSYSNRDDVRDDYRLSGSYTLDLGEKFGKHNLLAFAARSEAKYGGESFTEVNLAPDRPALSIYSNLNPVIRMAHIDPFSDNLAERGMPDPWKNPIPSGRIFGAPQYGFEDGWARTGLGTVWERIDSAALALQSSFLHDRIVTTAGVRHDSIKAWQTETIGDWGATDIVTGQERLPDPTTDESKTTFTFGAVVGITDWLSVYGNRSTNFKPQPAATLYGDINDQPLVGPIKGAGTDAGLKFKLLEDRLYATVGWFRVRQTNEATGFNGLVDQYIDAIWTTIANGGPGSDVIDQHMTGGGDTQGVVSDGYELEVVANLTPTWRLMFNVSHAENVTSGIDARLEWYVAQNIDEWNQYRDLNYDNGRPPGNVGNNTIGALIDDLENLIAIDQAGEGMQKTGSRPWNANLFTSYDFSTGRLKGLTIGGGINYRGDAILGIDTSDPLRYREVKGRSYYLASAMAAYRFQLGEKVTARIQLNIDNLFDNDDLQVLASNFQGGTTNFMTYYFEPRRYSLSTTFEF